MPTITKQLLADIKSRAFDKQLDFIKDKSKRKALFVGRRSGKTTAVAILYLLYALSQPGWRSVYVGLSQGSAADAFEPAILPLLKDFKIQHKYNLNSNEFFFPQTNSTIAIKGFDNSYKEMEKILGSKCYAVCLDECQSQTQDIKKALLYKIGPAVSDALPYHGGLVITAGTAGDYMGDHEWYKINTSPDHLGWSQHSWNHLENPHMSEARRIEIDDWIKRYGCDANGRPNYLNEIWYQQQYLNLWVRDEAAICYTFNRDINTADKLPVINGAKWEYFMGIDLGFEDDNALVVFAYNKFSRVLYVVASRRFNHATYHEIAAEIIKLMNIYPCQKMIVDTGGGGKVVAKTFGQDFGIPMVPADKAGDKKTRIARMNSYLKQGRIAVLPGNEDLINEWQNLRWNKHKQDLGIWEEDEKYKNHLGDAALYGFTSTYLYLAEPPPKEIAHLPTHSEFYYQVQAQDRKRDAMQHKHASFSNLMHKRK